ncbi:MAG: hypothetical protein KDE26_10425 [Bacteroidetes bacterium]|nr:hypothetical protein [Bacteroidota bacterium]
MKHYIHLFLMLFIGFFCTNDIFSSNILNMMDSPFDGTYTGTINETPVSLTLKSNGANISGKIDAEGYIYQLEGKISGNKSTGKFSDPKAGGVMDYEANLSGKNLHLILTFPNPNNGQTERLDFYFTKVSSSTQTKPNVSSSQPHSVNPSELDSRLFGTWEHTETYISGQFSSVTQVFMKINSDGTYLYGNARVMAGGNNSWGSTSGDTGQSNDMVRAYWKAQNSIIYVSQDGRSWNPYANYYTEPGRLLFKFGDGSNQLWNKQ